MRILFTIFLLFSFIHAEQSYKKIVLGSFKDISFANEHLETIKKRLYKDDDFNQIASTLGLELAIEKQGSYFGVIVKPFAKSKDVIQTIKIVRKYQADAFLKSYVDDDLPRATPQVIIVPITVPMSTTKPERVEANHTAVEVEPEEKPIEKHVVLPDAQKASAASEKAVDIKVTPIEEKPVGVYAMIERFPLVPWVLSLVLGLFLLVMMNAYRKLKAINAELEEEHLSSDVAIKTKDEFLAKMSHEIRTPMHAIVGFSHLLLDTKLDEEQLRNLSKIKGSADILLEIINDILDFSKLEAGMFKLDKIEFNINTILENAANLVAVEAKKRRLEFVFDIDHNVPIKLIGDPLRVDMILINLLSNAVKFTNEGEVVLKVKNVQRDNGIVLSFEIKDTGIGIAEEKIPELFKSFSQADNSTTRVYGGTGLGLVITKELIELMGGSISVTSQLNIGTTFTFDLHFDQPEYIEKRKYRLPSKEIMKKKVLIVDQNSTAADSLTRMISYYQYSSDVVETMDEVLYALEILPYDIICIDSKIIANDVEKFISIIKEKTHAKIVLLNGGIKNYSKIQGIDSELFKPFNQQDLFNTILDLYQPVEIQSSLRSKGITKRDLKVLSGSTILLAEDNQINQSVISSLLRDSGVNLLIANNGQEAVDMLYSNKHIDLVLMDISMPVLNGYDAASKIRADEQFNTLPILALTANALSSDIAKSKEIGMQEHMSKPLNVEQFYRALLKYISHRFVESSDEMGAAEDSQGISHKSEISLNLHALNIDDAIERTGNDERLYKEILIEFEKQYKHSSGKLDECRIMGEFERGQKLCHDIKGVAANIGAEELSQSAKSLEYAFKSKSIQTGDSAIIHYNRALEKVLIDIQGYAH
jgi:signal transduction histidine kinase/CheY-like chemotaxis protein/HPt (histidine-containing phosphotransfer) domain-containing protein